MSECNHPAADRVHCRELRDEKSSPDAFMIWCMRCGSARRRFARVAKGGKGVEYDYRWVKPRVSCWGSQ